MDNLSTTYPPLYVTQVNPGLPPQSWLEQGLQGQALLFRLSINDHEVILVLQNPSYLAEIVSEGMRLGMDAFGRSH